MGMKAFEIRRDAAGEHGVVDPLTQLMESRVSASHATPQYAWRTFGRKRTHTFKRKKKLPNLQCAQTSSECFDTVFLNVTQKTQRKMKLILVRPAHVGQWRDERRESALDRRRKCDREKKTARAHAVGWIKVALGAL
jgi:hypothetical protein